MKKRYLAAGVCLFLLSGCLAKRDFRSPKDRITDGTAYTLTHGEMRATAGLLGVGPNNFGANLGFAGGFGKHAEAGANLAHAAFGVLSVYGKYNFVDEKWGGLSAGLGLVWTRPSALWVLPDSMRDKLGGIDILTLPVQLGASFPVTDWLGLHLIFGYNHSSIFGAIDEETTVADGAIGLRQIYFEPLVTFYLVNQAVLFVGGHLQAYGVVQARLVAEKEIVSGFAAGARSDEWIEVPFEKRSHLTFGFELKWGKTTYTRLYAIYNGALSRSGLIPSPVLPGLDLYWRF